MELHFKKYNVMNIYFVDYLGIHTGVPYFMAAFKKFLLEIPGVRVTILSNFTDDESQTPFFKNQYIGNKLQKGMSLIYNLLKLSKFISNHKNAVYIYSTYGNWIDEKFIRIIGKTPTHLIDIHEAIAQNVDSDKRLKRKFKKLYSEIVTGVISHSARTDNFLKEYGYTKQYFFVPHFKYILPKNYNVDNIASDIYKSIDENKINLLFFGNLNESKGVDILIEAVNMLDMQDADKLKIIIAGKDFDGAVDRVKPLDDRKVEIIRRRINDDELKYLYQKADYLALPYRKTSQSGILEMAFYFKKPIIASDVEYFRKTLDEFPSFGVLSGNSAGEYAKTLSEVVACHDHQNFFSDDDYARYENRKEVADFKLKLEEWLKNL